MTPPPVTHEEAKAIIDRLCSRAEYSPDPLERLTLAAYVEQSERERDELKAKLVKAAERSGGDFLLMLCDYERTNLRMALECIMTLKHFAPLHTGDWTGMVRWALGEPELAPNMSVEAVRAHVERWFEKPNKENASLVAVVREHAAVIRNALLFEMQLTRGTPDEETGRKALAAAKALAEVLDGK